MHRSSRIQLYPTYHQDQRHWCETFVILFGALMTVCQIRLRGDGNESIHPQIPQHEIKNLDPRTKVGLTRCPSAAWLQGWEIRQRLPCHQNWTSTSTTTINKLHRFWIMFKEWQIVRLCANLHGWTVSETVHWTKSSSPMADRNKPIPLDFSSEARPCHCVVRLRKLGLRVRINIFEKGRRAFFTVFYSIRAPWDSIFRSPAKIGLFRKWLRWRISAVSFWTYFLSGRPFVEEMCGFPLLFCRMSQV